MLIYIILIVESSIVSILKVKLSGDQPSIFNPIKQGGALGQLVDNPFGAGYGQGALEGCDEDEWVVSRDKLRALIKSTHFHTHSTYYIRSTFNY